MPIKSESSVRKDSIAIIRQAVRELQEATELAIAMPRENCLIRRSLLKEQLRLIDENLPDSFRQAEDVIREEEKILAEARRSAEETKRSSDEMGKKLLEDANKQANKIRSESRTVAEETRRIREEAQKSAEDTIRQAEMQAQTILQQAQQSAAALWAKANQDAQTIRDNAQLAAAEAVHKDNVYRRAVVEANELKEKTAQELEQMRQYYYDDMDKMLGSMDQYLVQMINAIRQERYSLGTKR